ncbi:DUF4167 domain-containing protein [Leisingera daeponensis]|uniref:DUF4167 domain-containing protein n=1 Tax=Leisingera daeponensis TaxID=405746 RepID=UPI000484C805|nr:DUF4167 domain-containing protein [Leisingera daeponensis]
MRSSKSRSRSKSNRNRPNGANVVNRVFDSSGPEGKVRGTPQQIIDKYNQLARDAQLSNDRVAAENFQQHAEHYLRMLNEAQREIDARREEQERQNRERQAERDRERAERLERQERESASAVPASDLADSPQPEVIDPRGDNGNGADSGLVETPESQSAPADASAEAAPKKAPARKPRARKPTAKGDDTAEASDGGGDAEAKPAPKKTSRPRAKPKPKTEDGPAEAAE